jgi:hypothetical protein
MARPAHLMVARKQRQVWEGARDKINASRAPPHNALPPPNRLHNPVVLIL